MPVTLEQAKLNVQDALQLSVIDEFRKSNFILNNIPFDNAVSPTGGGTTLTYAYTRLLTQPSAGFRAINSDYTPSEVTKKRMTADLKIFGGSFEIDRVIANMGGIVNEVTIQMEQKIKATRAVFNDTVINGDSATDEKAFDGLEKALKGSSTELTPGAAIDLSNSEKVSQNYTAFLDMLDEFLLKLDGRPSALLCNSKLLAKIRAVARRATMYSVTTNNFGEQVEMYGNIPIVDLGTKAGSNEDVISTNGGTGETSLYAVRFGIDGFHAVTVADARQIIIAKLPKFDDAGAVKKGDVEMVAAVALKASKAAGVLRKIKVQ